MRIQPRPQARRGSIIAMTAVCMVAIVGFVALSLDVGMMMVARTQAQLAADAGAMAGCRTLNGDVANNNNFTNAGPAAQTGATACKILSKSVQSSWVSSEIGCYTYNQTTKTFGKQLPSAGYSKPSGENWSLVTTTVSFTDSTYFARALGTASYSLTATAVAVHRPRDVCIIVDFSGSMSFDSLLGGSYTGSRTQSLNPDTLVPTFGHYYSSINTTGYNPVATSTYVLSTGMVLGLCNLTADTAEGTAMAKDYYQNNLGATAVQAFTSQPASYGASPGGDLPVKRNFNNASNNFATNVLDVMNITSWSGNGNTTWEPNAGNTNANNCGYSLNSLNSGSSKTFNGYTMGPGYWGKTFFMWPPDPRTPSSSQPGDWRKRFFLKTALVAGGGIDDNSKLWTTGTSPVAKVPASSSTANYFINYAAILRWLVNTGTNPFPTQLRSGRISYYTAIPDVSNTANDDALNARFYIDNPTNLNERFWKQYIDFVLGFSQTGVSGSVPIYSDISASIGYGADFEWQPTGGGATSISAKPTTGTPVPYMNYADNPPRSPTRFWFGPMTFLDFIDNYNNGPRWSSGISHQCPTWACKIGLRAALADIKNNHPNDYVAMSYFATPEYSANDGGRFNQIIVPLGRSYSQLSDSLFYPPITITDPTGHPEVNVYDTTNMRPIPHGDGGTCTVMSLLQAYNQFSCNSTLQNYNPSPAPTGQAGGLGRKGAQKVVILETDGMANALANATLDTSGGAYNCYYKIRNGEYPTNSQGSYTSLNNQIYGVAQNICNMDTASTPGYSTVRKPALIHCIAFGSLFDATASPGATTMRDQANTLLQQVQYIGGTQSDPATALPSYKVIIGTSDDRITNLQTAFKKIMQDTVSVTLIE